MRHIASAADSYCASKLSILPLPFACYMQITANYIFWNSQNLHGNGKYLCPSWGRDARTALSHCVRSQERGSTRQRSKVAAAMQEAARWPIATWFFHPACPSKKRTPYNMYVDLTAPLIQLPLEKLGNKLRRISQNQIEALQSTSPWTTLHPTIKWKFQLSNNNQGLGGISFCYVLKFRFWGM